MRRFLFLIPLALLAVACQDQDPTVPMAGPQFAEVEATGGSSLLSPKEALGKAIYFDKSLSLNNNQSCATCHDPDFGFTGPFSGINLRGAVYMGSVGQMFGNRKPPSAAYATQAAILFYDGDEDLFEGGNFWDGRATGEGLGSPAADQALGPFLNEREQALPHAICVLYTIAEGPYADLWEEVWGDDLRDNEFPEGLDKWCRGKGDVDLTVLEGWDWESAYGRVGLSIAEFEASSEVNAFSSKFDAYLLGMAELTAEKALGLELFNGKAMCSACHISDPDDQPQPLFTDYTYDNLGIPANPLNPFYAVDVDFVDEGLGAFLETRSEWASFSTDNMGKVKVPTLRNVAKAPGRAQKAYGHNGVFKSLEQIVHFYNTRDTKPVCLTPPVTVADLVKMGDECWPGPEVADNVNTTELGDLGLTAEEEAALVAFMKTLSDGWR